MISTITTYQKQQEPTGGEPLNGLGMSNRLNDL
jgi:hypothetical protein